MYNPSVSIDELINIPTINVLYVSSFVPRKCGIATFCRDVAEGIRAANPDIQTHVMAVVDKMSESLSYPTEVEYVVPQNEWSYYQHVIKQINETNKYDVVCIQHEFGLYGGYDGEFIIPFIKQINKPVVTTLHTIMPNPEPSKVKIIRELCKHSDQVIVMLPGGVKILSEVYGVKTDNISVIPHGVPHFADFKTEQVKKELGLGGKVVMTSVNLISPNKGIEHAIRSLPSIVKEVPNFVYQIVGETHPVFVKNELGGIDTFRQNLIQLTKELGVSKNVRFVNKYVSVEELVRYVASSDYYVTPYLDPQQITSGALAYAIGAGKVCISTPYIYAKELLGNGRGVLVDFKDSEAIAQSVIKMEKNPLQRQRREKRTLRVGQQMTWPAVGNQYATIFSSLITPAVPFHGVPKDGQELVQY